MTSAPPTTPPDKPRSVLVPLGDGCRETMHRFIDRGAIIASMEYDRKEHAYRVTLRWPQPKQEALL